MSLQPGDMSADTGTDVNPTPGISVADPEVLPSAPVKSAASNITAPYSTTSSSETVPLENLPESKGKGLGSPAGARVEGGRTDVKNMGSDDNDSEDSESEADFGKTFEKGTKLRGLSGAEVHQFPGIKRERWW